MSLMIVMRWWLWSLLERFFKSCDKTSGFCLSCKKRQQVKESKHLVGSANMVNNSALLKTTARLFISRWIFYKHRHCEVTLRNIRRWFADTINNSWRWHKQIDFESAETATITNKAFMFGGTWVVFFVETDNHLLKNKTTDWTNRFHSHPRVFSLFLKCVAVEELWLNFVSLLFRSLKQQQHFCICWMGNFSPTSWIYEPSFIINLIMSKKLAVKLKNATFSPLER